ISGQIALHEGDVTTARSLIEQSLTLRKKIADPWGTAESLSLLAQVAFSTQAYTAARAFYEESLTILKELDDKELVATFQQKLAEVVAAQEKSSMVEVPL